MPQPCFEIINNSEPSTGYSDSGSISNKAQSLEETISKTVVSREQNIPDTTYKPGIYLIKDDDLAEISRIVDKIVAMGFAVEEREDVERYLFIHGTISKNIVQACRVVKDKFKQIKNIVVKTYRDIENPSETYLLIGLKTDGFVESIYENIKSLYNDPVFNFPKDSGDWVQIEMDY